MLFMFFIMMVMVLRCVALRLLLALRRNSAIVTTYIHSICMYYSTYVCVHHCVRANASNLCTSTIDCTYNYDS